MSAATRFTLMTSPSFADREGTDASVGASLTGLMVTATDTTLLSSEPSLTW